MARHGGVRPVLVWHGSQGELGQGLSRSVMVRWGSLGSAGRGRSVQVAARSVGLGLGSLGRAFRAGPVRSRLVAVRQGSHGSAPSGFVWFDKALHVWAWQAGVSYE